MKHNVNIVDVDLTEEGVMNPDAFGPDLKGWRLYRIEYGGCNEDCLWEGRILLPPRADRDAVADLIMGMQAREQIWTPL